jgi:hypothetical protein
MQVISELVLGKADPGLREPEVAFDYPLSVWKRRSQ